VVRARTVLFVALSLLLALPLGLALFRNISQWTEIAAEVPIPKAQWKAFYEVSPVPCEMDVLASPACPAHPDNPALWQSAVPRDSQDEHKRQVNLRPGQEYWIGVSFTAEQLQQAYTRQANFFILGWIRGSYRAWINGHQIISGEWADNEPLVLQLPLEWLSAGRPLKLAIRALKTIDINDAPDLLEESPKLGFATKASATSWRRYESFWGTSRPLVFLALNFLLAWIFFGVWLVAPEKTEYFYIAVLAMTFASFHERYLEFFYVALDRRFVNGFGLTTSILHAFAGMLAGFAFARLRQLYMTILSWLCIALSVLSPFVFTDTITQQKHSGFWLGGMANIGTLFGALACFMQAFHLYENAENRVRLRLRISRLTAFGLGLVLLTALNQVNVFSLMMNFGGPPTITKLLFGKSGPFFLLLSMGLIALSEYRAQHTLAQSMPVSKFHQMNPLPESVHGVLLTVDLKDSERISRLSAKLGKAGDLVETCLSHMWMATSDQGGLVLQTEGDALRALFAATDVVDPLTAALAAADAMGRNLAALERRFRSQGLAEMIPPDGLHFRGALVEGDIRPLWQDYGGTRLAGWVETGHSNVFIEASRLLELERQVKLATHRAASIVIVPTESRARIATKVSPGRWMFEKNRFVGKHGQIYEVAAYEVGPADPLLH
jgi:hypothetical protein